MSGCNRFGKKPGINCRCEFNFTCGECLKNPVVRGGVHTDTRIDKNKVRLKVDRALECQFSDYSWGEMINDTDLTAREKKWAKEHISYHAYISEEHERMDNIEAAARRVIEHWATGALGERVRELAAALGVQP